MQAKDPPNKPQQRLGDPRAALLAITTIAALGAVGAPMVAGAGAERRSIRCPKCTRGQLRGSSALYCHRCGFFVTAEVVRAQGELAKLSKAIW